MPQNEDKSFPGISVIVITKNEEQNISVCLNSLMKQEYPVDRWECIVVDSSSDKTPEIVREYSSVRLLEREAGFSRQRNEGIGAARFDIIAFTDADTIIPETWLRGIADGFATHLKSAGLAGDAFPPLETGWLGRCIAAVGHPAGGAIGLDANTELGPGGISFVPGCNGAFRKGALKVIGGYDVNFDTGGEDIDLSRRLRAADYRLDYEPGMAIFHKPHGPLLKYAEWNIGVGVTKHSLHKPSPSRMLIEPGSLLWFILAFFLFIGVFTVHPLLAVSGIIGLHLALQLILRIWSKPYRLLLLRWNRVELDALSVWLVVPVLVYIRQLFINVGMWKRWKNLKKSEKG